MLWGDASQVHEVASQHPLLRLVLATNGPGISGLRWLAILACSPIGVGRESGARLSADAATNIGTAEKP